MAVNLATAYVEIIPSAKGIGSSIINDLKGVQATASKTGAQIGSRLSSGMKGTFAKGASKAGSEAGKAAGDEFVDSADRSMSGLKIGAVAGIFSALTQSVVGSFGDLAAGALQASDATDKFKQTMDFAGIKPDGIEAAAKAAQSYADKTVYNLSDIQSMVAQLAANGIQDYTGLAQAAGNLNAVAGGNAETFKSVGMVMSQTAGAGKLTTENFNQLADAIPGASGQIQQALLEAGAYTGNFRKAMENGEITAEEFNAAVMKLGSQPIAQEAAQSTKTFEGMLGNLKATIEGSLANALNAIKPLIGSVFDGLNSAASTVLPVLVSGLEAAVSGLQSFGSWVQNNRDWIEPLAVSLGVLVGAYKMLTLQQSIAAAGSFVKWFTQLNAVTKIHTAVTTAAAGAQAALNLVMNANPMFLIVTAIAAVVAGLVYFFTQTETGKRLWASFMEFMGQVWENIKNWAQAAWDWIVQVWNGIPEWFGEKWNAVKETVSQAWEGIKTAISNAWTAITEWFAAAWEAYKAQVQANWEFVKSIFSAAWEGIKNIVILAWNGIQTFFTTAWTIFTTLVQTVWNGIVLVFQTVWNTILMVIQTVWTTIATWIQAAWTAFVAVASAVWNGIVAVVQAAWMWISTTIQSVWNAVSSFITGAWEAFKSFTQSTWDSVKQIITSAWEAAKAAVIAAWEAIKSAVAAAVAALIAKLQEMANNIRTYIDKAVSFLSQFPGKVKQVFANAGSWLISAGKAIIRGLINGIKSMAGAIGSAISSILPGAVRGLVSFSLGGIALADGGVMAQAFAGGGRRRERHVAQIAPAGAWRLWAEPETGGEAYIPLARAKRKRSTAILSDVAKIFGLQLVDRDGQRVQAWTAGGTGPVGKATQVFANGGIRTPDEFLRFARGENVDGVQAARPLDGAPYVFGGSNWGDCSGTASAFAAFAIGLNPFPRKFATMDEEQWLRANGFTIGRGAAGTFRVGWYNGGSGGGHTSVTLPDGTAAEMGGSSSSGKLGGNAAGADHPQYTHHAWYPAKAEPASTAVVDDSVAPVEATPTVASSGSTSGGDENMVPLDDDVQAKAEAAGIDQASTTTGGQTSGASTWSETFGELAKSFVSGHVEDILSVFGIPNELPPIVKAGKQMFVRADKNDPDGKKSQGEIEAAADAKLEAEAAVTVDGEAQEALSADSAESKKPASDVEQVKPVSIGTVSMGPYKLGADFYAEEIARAAAERNMGFKAAKIAYATTLVEVGNPPKMYASSVDTASQQYPHEAIGSDHDSSGLFQQRNNGAWGTIAQRMNARGSASMFLNALSKVPNWQTMDEGAAAQAVQRSAFPSRYAGMMATAEQVMNRFKGKLPGFKKGGLVTGGKRKKLDDVIARLSKGEMVINSDAVDADPKMAAQLNAEGPDAVRATVLSEAAKEMPKLEAGETLRETLSNVLHGSADMFSTAVESSVAAGFDFAGSSAQSAASAIPGMSEIGGMLPITEAAGFFGDIGSWYAGEVSSGIGHAFADLGLGLYDIGFGRVEEFTRVFNANPWDMVPMTAGMREFNAVGEESLEKRSEQYAKRTGSGDTFIFNANNRGDMESMFRKQLAKRSKGKVGAR